jgi:hypothetical protein
MAEEHEKQPFLEVPSKRRSSKSNLIRRLFEGPIRATREGGEWEPIKILLFG